MKCRNCFTAVGGFTLCLIAIAAASIPCSRLTAQTNEGASSTKPSAANTPTDQDLADLRTRAILDRHIPEISFNGNAFSDVTDFLRDVSGANIVVNWSSLGKVGVSKDTPVTMRVRDLALGKTLDLILIEAGNGKAKLTYTIDHGVIQIDVAGAGAFLVVASYDVSPLLAARPDLATDLPASVMKSVAPSSWIEKGGATGMIKLENAKLYVTQTAENQKAIAALLDELKNQPSKN